MPSSPCSAAESECAGQWVIKLWLMLRGGMIGQKGRWHCACA